MNTKIYEAFVYEYENDTTIAVFPDLSNLVVKSANIETIQHVTESALIEYVHYCLQHNIDVPTPSDDIIDKYAPFSDNVTNNMNIRCVNYFVFPFTATI